VDVLVTCGATRNPVDAMRYLSARSSGTTGIAIARAALAAGHSPWLMGSAEARLRDPELPGEEYGSTRDLMARMERWVRAHPAGAVVHAAAVGDYEVRDADSGKKTPSGMAEWTLTLHPTPKIADHLRGWGLTGRYVTFKAAGPGTSEAELEGIARRQRERTGCDRVFANVLGQLGHGILIVGDDVRRFDDRDAAIDALVRWLLT
jgi:phosphopantothenoylcysteine synthetase/decarboxylase